MEDKKVSRRTFLKNAGKILIASPLVLKVLENDARADFINYDGFLNIENYVNSIKGSSPLRPMHYDNFGVSDGYDASFDVDFLNPLPNKCGIYSDIGTHKFRSDYRLPSSIADFNVKLIYNGTLSEAKPNHLTFSFLDTNFIFGDKEILFESDLLPFGPVVDVRKAIAQNGGVVPLKNLPAGSYSPSTPYGSGVLTIGTRKLADLNDDGNVNFKDHAHLANDFGKPQGQYVGDITGAFGIPDGYVDYRDLESFTENWLQ